MATKKKSKSKTNNIGKAHNAMPRHMFLAVWQTVGSVDEFLQFAEGMGHSMKAETAVARANRYRAGSKRHNAVELKRLEGEHDGVAQLNLQIEDLIKMKDMKAIKAFITANTEKR